MPPRREFDADTSAWVRGAARGDGASLERLVARLTPALLVQAEHRVGASLRRVVDPADVVSDVWLAALPKLGAFEPPAERATAALLSFLGVILLRRVRDLYEKHIAGKPATLSPASGEDASGCAREEDAAADTTGVVTRAVRGERHAALREALAGMDEIDRAVVTLRAIEGRRMDAVAEAAGLSPNAASARLRRALDKLRRALPSSVFDELDDGD